MTDSELDEKVKLQLWKLYEFHKWCNDHNIIIILKLPNIFLN